MGNMNLYKETKGGEFFKLLEESFKKSSKLEGFVKKGKVVAVENDSIIVDVGLKSEGIVPLRQLDSTTSKEIKAGDIWYVPSNVVHGGEALGDDPIIFVDIYSPPNPDLKIL